MMKQHTIGSKRPKMENSTRFYKLLDCVFSWETFSTFQAKFSLKFSISSKYWFWFVIVFVILFFTDQMYDVCVESQHFLEFNMFDINLRERNSFEYILNVSTDTEFK